MNKFLHTFVQGLILISSWQSNLFASKPGQSTQITQSKNINPTLFNNRLKQHQYAISKGGQDLQSAIENEQFKMQTQNMQDITLNTHKAVLEHLQSIQAQHENQAENLDLSAAEVKQPAVKEKPAIQKPIVEKQLALAPVVVVEQAPQINSSLITIEHIMENSKQEIDQSIKTIIDLLSPSEDEVNKIMQTTALKLLDNVFTLQDGKIKELKNPNLNVQELQQKYKDLIVSYDQPQQEVVTELLTPLINELKKREPSWLQQTMDTAGDVFGIADTAAQVTAAAVSATAQEVQENVQAFHEDVTAPILQAAHENVVAPAAQALHNVAETTLRKAADWTTGRSEEIAVKFITTTQPCNDGVITKEIQKKLDVEKATEHQNPLNIQTKSLTEAALDAIPGNAPEMVQTIAGTKKILSDITQGLYRMLGYPPKISLTVQSEINQTAEKIVADTTVTTEQDHAKFNKKLKKYISAIIPKLISLITKEDPRNIQIIEIPVSSGDLLAAKVKISYNKSTNNIQSAIVTYDGRSYNLDVSKLTIKEDGSFTISSPLYNKSQKPSLILEYIIKPTAKALGKKVLDNVKYEDKATQNLYNTFIDFVYDKITDPNSDGQIEIVARIDKKTGETFLVKKTITQKQADASMQTVSQQAEQTNIELTGRAGDRFAPKSTLSINSDNQLQEFDIQHELFYSQDNKLIRDTIKPISKSIDYKDDTYTMVAIFQEPGNRALSAEATNLLQALSEQFVTKKIIQPAIFEGDALQNMRAADPAAERVLKETEAYTSQAADKAIEMVVATYNKNTKEITTYTIKLLTDNSRTITRLSYPIRDSEVISNRTVTMPKNMTNINVESLQGLFKREESPSN